MAVWAGEGGSGVSPCPSPCGSVDGAGWPRIVLRDASRGVTWFGRRSPGRGGRNPKSGGTVSGARLTTANSSGPPLLSIPKVRRRSLQPASSRPAADRRTTANRGFVPEKRLSIMSLNRLFPILKQAVAPDQHDPTGKRRLRDIEGRPVKIGRAHV